MSAPGEDFEAKVTRCRKFSPGGYDTTQRTDRRNMNTLFGNPRKRRVVYLLLIIVASYLFFFYNLGGYSLKEPDEGRYAEISREMVEQGDYLVPHLNYVRYFEKPPLLYWVTALSYKAFGVNEWSFRFPNALAALLCVLATYLFASRRFGEDVGFMSAFILMTSLGFFAMSRIVTIDMLFAFLLSAALFCFHEFYTDGRRRFLNLFLAVLAMAVLAKGPVAIILMAGTILIFLFLERRLSFLKQMATVDGFLLFTAVAAPWFVLMCIKEREFFGFFFVDQHILRFLTTKHKRSGPLYYFIPVLFGGLFPWSIFIPRAIVRFWRAKEMRLLLIWSLVVFVFFSVSGSKLTPYILPIFPALSVVLGCLFKAAWNERVGRKGEIFIYTVFFACLAVTGIVYGIPGFLDTYINRAPDLSSLRMDVRGLSLGLSFVASVLFFASALGQMRTFRRHFVALSAFSIAVIVGIMLHTPVIDRLNTTKALAQTINEIKGDNHLIVNLNSFDETLPFYIRQRTYLAGYTGELAMGAKYQEAKDFFVDRDRFVRIIRSDKPVLVVFKEKRLAQMEELEVEGLTLLRCQDKRCLAANRGAMKPAAKNMSSKQ
jgi:4-amino-4-deoxy-L-arabinose transferase-like glycosyltransferase